jgi:hypothetical protein
MLILRKIRIISLISYRARYFSDKSQFDGVMFQFLQGMKQELSNAQEKSEQRLMTAQEKSEARMETAHNALKTELMAAHNDLKTELKSAQEKSETRTETAYKMALNYNNYKLLAGIALLIPAAVGTFEWFGGSIIHPLLPKRSI